MLRLLHISSFVLLATVAMAQSNLDSLFSVAISSANAKHYELAIEKASEVVKLDSTRQDVKLFIANVYAWQADYEGSKKYINEVYASSPTNKELYDTWLNVLLWNSEYRELFKVIDTAKLNGYSDNYNLIFKKALAYQGLEQYTAGINYLNQNQSALDSVAVSYVYNELKRAGSKNTVSAYYRIDYFENNSPQPQHLAYLDYSTSIDRTIFIVRCNYANRFDFYDLQPEIDVYHNLENGHYIYANYGIGLYDKLFAHNRFALEYFYPFGKGFEVSLGDIYLDYPKENVSVITGHLGKYVSNLWFAFRPYYTIQEGDNSWSYLFNMRAYGANQIAYYGLELSYGYTPNDKFAYAPVFLNAYKVRLEKNILLSHSNELKLGVGYSYEEVNKDIARNRLLFELLFKHRF